MKHSGKGWSKITEEAFETTKSAVGFKKLLSEVLKESEHLGSQFKNVKDLQKAMGKDAKLYKEVQEKIYKMGDKAFDKLQKEIKEKAELVKMTKGDKERIKFEVAQQEKLEKLQEESGNIIEEKLNNLVAQEKTVKKIKQHYSNMKDVIDDLAAQIRQPSLLAENFVAKLGQIPIYLKKSYKEGEGLKTIFKDASTALSGMAKTAGALFGVGGLLILGIGAVVAAMAGLLKLFTNYWDFLDKKVIPAQADFNREIGGTSKGVKGLSGQMQSAGVELELLGYSFQEGAAFVRDFAKAANTGIALPKDILKTAKELTFVLGLTADQAGRLTMAFQKQGAGAKEINETFQIGAKVAKEYALPVNDVLREIGDAPDILARFGIANRKEFAISTAKSRSYGLSIKEVNEAFGKQLDTFEGSSVAAAKLNTIFGTTINSMSLMLEKDPTKRMEMLRQQLLKTGKSWEQMSVAEKNVITNTLGVSESQAALVLSSDKERQKLEKQAKQRAANARVDEQWNQGLKSIMKTLLPWQALLDKLARKVSNFVAKLFGFKDAQDPIMQTAQGAEKAFKIIDGWIDELTGNVKEFRQTLSSIKDTWDLIFNTAESKTADDIVNMFKGVNGNLKNLDTSKIIDLQDRMKQFGGDEKKFAEILERKLVAYEGLSSAEASAVLNKVENPYSDLQKNQAPAFSVSAPGFVNVADAEPITDKPKEVKPKQKVDKKAVEEKAKKAKEERKKEDKEKNQDLAEAIANKMKGGPQEIILRDMDGSYIGKGIVRTSRGTR